MKAKIVFGILLVAISSPTLAQQYCITEFEKASSNIQAKYRPELDATLAEIKRIQDIGLDPNRYVVDFEGKLVPLTVKASTLYDRYSNELSTERGRAEGCIGTSAPAQMLVDIGKIYGTGGLSILLPKNMTNVDASAILNGYPLGGQGAVIPTIREKILNGDRGDVANFVRDPVGSLKKLF